MEEKLRQLFDLVAADRQSPLYGQFSPAATRAGTVSRVTFNNALRKVVEAGVLANMASIDDQARLVVNFLIASDRIIRLSGAENNDLTKSTILQAFFEIFNEVADMALKTQGRLKPDVLTNVMTPLGNLDFDAYIGSNRPSKGKLVADMRSALIEAPAVTADML
jgi:hypothetical protein